MGLSLTARPAAPPKLHADTPMPGFAHIGNMVARTDMARRALLQHDTMETEFLIDMIDLQLMAYRSKRLDSLIVGEPPEARIERESVPCLLSRLFGQHIPILTRSSVY